MTCYFRHLGDVFGEAGIVVSKDNRKAVDEAVHRIVGTEYKDCPSTWRAVKEQVRGDPETRRVFVERLAEALG